MAGREDCAMLEKDGAVFFVFAKVTIHKNLLTR